MLLPLSPRRTPRACFIAIAALVTLTGGSPAPAPGAIFGQPVKVQEFTVREQSTSVALSSSWAWPVKAPHPLIRPFIAPQTQYSAGHRGIDIAASADTIVRAPADGVIHFSGFVVNRGVISIDHGSGIISSFEPVLSELTEGTRVRRGQQIGVLQSGHCSTPCLHLGVRVHGQYVSPLNYLGGLERSVLLPTRQSR